MAVIKLQADSQVNHLTTELNSLASGSNKISAAIDNTSALRLFEDLEFNAADPGTTPLDAAAVIEVYLLASLDGSSFPDGSDSILPASSSLVGVFNFRTAAVAQRHVIRGIVLPPNFYKYLIRNLTGEALASSDNVFSGISFGYQTV